MERWRRLVRAVRSLAGRGPVHDDLDAELTGYLEMLADEKTASGVSADEAMRQARLELGGMDQVKEQVRDVRPGAWLETVARDVRHGFAQLVKVPVFSVTVVLVLALAIGANVAVFGLVNVLLLRPRTGLVSPAELVALHVHDPARPESYRRFSYAEYDDIREHATMLREIAVHRNLRVILSDGDVSRNALACEVSASYFSTLGVRMSAGRTFTAQEERPGSAAPVAIINHDTWQSLGGRLSVLGQTVTVNARRFTVVGIAPEGFSGTMAAFGPQLWLPLGADQLIRQPEDEAAGTSQAAPEAARNLSIVARMASGLTVAGVNAGLGTLSPRLQEHRPSDAAKEVVTANGLARTEDSDVPEDDSGLYVPMATLAGMAALLLLVASLNVANMQLARGTTRRKEIATRLALGAGRGRVIGQLMVEGAMLSVAGGVIGLVLGHWTLRLVAAAFSPVVDQALSVPDLPDVRVLLATGTFCLFSASLFALGPALKLSRVNVLDDLKGRGDGDAGSGKRPAGPRNLVVAWQVALSFALLATAGLFVRAAIAASQAEPGYRLEHQVLLRVSATGLTATEARRAYAELLERVRAVRGVEAASPASLVAFSNNHSSGRVSAAGASGTGPGAGAAAQDYAVGSGYFGTLGLAVVSGREFTEAEERQPAPSPVAIIDEPLARALFPGKEAVGQYVELPASRPGGAVRVFQVVGLVAGQRERLTDRAPVAHLYRPLGNGDERRLNIHVRLGADAWAGRPSVLSALRDAVRAADGRLALLGASSLSEARDQVPLSWLIRAAGYAFGGLGLVGLAMAVAGLYGVKAYLVGSRTREIGIRMALGATPQRVVGMVVKDGSRMLAAGLALGFALALAAGHLVSRMVVGVRALDPLVFAVAAVILAVSIAAASCVPARRATRIDPALAFRSE
jgi:putative ABC transport system permease protein